MNEKKVERKILSILIPTYNRSMYLRKNLDKLSIMIINLDEIDNIEIIVSDNSSIDDTDKIVQEISEKFNSVNIQFFQQKINVGLERNALEVLKVATGEYVMYIGDDDYIDINYLQLVLKEIRVNKSIGLILPSKKTIDPLGKVVGGGRDLNRTSKKFRKGFKNCLINGWRGHQLSGVVLKRLNLYKKYIDFGVNNIYPFIFFTSISALENDTYHITNYPVLVTEVSQNKKDWGYGNDGLINEIFDNYNKLPLNYFQRSILQLNQIARQDWRIYMYKGLKTLKTIKAILFSNNSTLLFKIFFIPLLLSLKMYKSIRKFKN